MYVAANVIGLVQRVRQLRQHSVLHQPDVDPAEGDNIRNIFENAYY
jgi:hypothetical protein